MRSDFIRNAEQYYDPTAGAALTKIERGKRMDWKPGDIVTASRDTAEKKFIVLANDGYVLTGTALLTREYDAEPGKRTDRSPERSEGVPRSV